MSNSSIMSVRDMIDIAFLDPDINFVNFKLIQSILYILARQLRILGRQVEVDLSPALKKMYPETSLSVTEIKINAPGGKKRKTGGKTSDQDKSSSDKQTLSDAKSSAGVSRGAPSTGSTKSVKGQPSETKIGVGGRSGAKSTTGQSGSKSTTERSGAEEAGKKTKKREQASFSVEETREVVLRVINQRADSHEEPALEPIPMASVTGIEQRQESLLIIERIPSSSSTAQSRSASQGRAPRLSIVTQEEFAELAAEVRKLQVKFGLPTFPENAELMERLREGASLTDAMSALQISARLEAAEQMLQKLIDIITEVAVSTGVDISNVGTGEEVWKMQPGGVTGPSSQDPTTPSRKDKAFAQPPPPASAAASTPAGVLKEAKDTDSEGSDEMPVKSATRMDSDEKGVKPVWITFQEFDEAMKELRGDIMKKVTSVSQRNTATAEAALKNSRLLEIKIEEALNLGNRMADLEVEVSEYSEQINSMDTGLSSQMTKYQEQLTQMQHELETGLENMAEALINVSGDPVAVAEMNGRLTSLQNDLEYTTSIQKDLRDSQNQFALDLQDIHKKIELLRETKSDREEVEDAFRDKAGLGALNGLVTREQFDAVRGDLEKRIRAAYEKFNSQEVVWQRWIDDFVREMNEKVDHIHVVSLRDEIHDHLNMINSRMNALSVIVGEPRAFALAKKINREAACLSCSTPANMSLEVPGIEAAMPTSALGKGRAEAGTKGSGDYSRPCYPGEPIPHVRDPRAHYCNRYCGGSHTRLPSAPARVPPHMTIKHCERTVVATDVGTDGKAYMVDYPRVPCAACNPGGASGASPTPRPDDYTQLPEETKKVPEFDSTNWSQAQAEVDTLLDLDMLPARAAPADGSATPPFTAES